VKGLQLLEPHIPDPRFLGQLAHDRVGRALSLLDKAAGDGPGARERLTGSPDQEHLEAMGLNGEDHRVGREGRSGIRIGVWHAEPPCSRDRLLPTNVPRMLLLGVPRRLVRLASVGKTAFSGWLARRPRNRDT